MHDIIYDLGMLLDIKRGRWGRHTFWIRSGEHRLAEGVAYDAGGLDQQVADWIAPLGDGFEHQAED